MADPLVVNIAEKTKYFYELAAMLFPILQDSVRGDRVTMTVETFVQRLASIIEKSDRRDNQSDEVFKRKCTLIETNMWSEH